VRLASGLVASVVLVFASPSYAQKSNTSGFMANIRLNSVSVTRPNGPDDQFDAEAGGGAGVRLGWGFSRNFTILVGLDAAKIDFKEGEADGDYSAGHFDIAVQYHFANPERKLVPYIEAGLTGLALASELEGAGGGSAGEFTQGGSGGTLGAGLNYFMTRSTALHLSLNFAAVEFENVEIGGTAVADSGGDAASVRLNFGVTFYPMKR
jgi:hypothetical protein